MLESARVANRRTEREIAVSFAGGIAWGTIALTAALAIAYGGVVIGAVSGVLGLWAGFALNSLLAYAFYTTHHEATHGNIGGDAEHRWIDRTLGRIAAIPLTLSYDGYAPVHMAHHAHTNVPGKDPDYFVAGSPVLLPVKWVVGVVVLPVVRALPWIGPVWAHRLGVPESTTEDAKLAQAQIRRYEQLCLVALFVAALSGHGAEALFLWWLPGRCSALFLMLTFQWLPHHPHTDTGRYRNTRIKRFAGSFGLLLGQDHHLIHHLHPRVPWYRYRQLFRALQPLLEAEGARIEG